MASNKQASKRIERDERAKARAEIAATAAAYREARAALVSHTRQTNAERRARAKQTAEEIRVIRRKLRAIPRALLEELRAARDSYRAWWAEVLVEKQRRRDAAVEFWSLVEANLEPEAAAWYRSHRRQFPGPSSGVPADQVAELVGEALEAEPELSVENMQDRADLKRMGYL